MVRLTSPLERLVQSRFVLAVLLVAAVAVSFAAPPGSAQTPELGITSLSVSGSGQNLTVSSTVQNNGAAAVSTAFQCGYYLSASDTVTTSATLLGSYTVSSLGIGASFTDSNRVLAIPGGTAPGSYYLGCIADSGGAIAETNETNNVSVAAGTVSVPFPAGIVVFPLDAPSTVSAGSTFIASFQVVNPGENTFVLGSVSLSFSGTGLTVTQRTIPASVAGESIATYSFNVAVANNADTHLQTASIAISGTDAVSGAAVSDSDAAAGTVQVLTVSTLTFTDASSNPKTLFDLGANDLFLTLRDADQNTSASTQQTVAVTVTSSSSGDRETFQLRETAVDSGVFRNVLAVQTSSAAKVDGDGVMQTAPGSRLDASYQDSRDATDRSTAAATIRLTPTQATGQFTNATGSQMFFYAIGVELVFVTLTDSDRNTDPTAVDTVTVTLTDGATNDRETLTLHETGAATGQFRNRTGLPSLRNPTPANNNNNLETADNSTVTFAYTDPTNADTASGNSVMKFTTPSTTRFTNQAGGAVTAYTLGIDSAYVTVIDADRNSSPSSQQEIPCRLAVSTTGDVENITLRETGNDTGIFRNTAGVPFLLAARSDNDGKLQVTGGAQLTATYTDPQNASDVTSSTAQVNGQQTASQTTFTDTTGTVQDAFLIAGPAIFVTVTDGDENTDPATRQTVQVNLVDGNTGDLEVLVLTETGVSTGAFRNTTGLPTLLGARVDRDGTLQTANLSNVSANYQDKDNSSDTSFSFAGMRLENTNSTTRFTDSAGSPLTQFKITIDPIFVTVEDRNRNDDINSRQSVSVLVRNQRSGDRETVVLLETGNNTGVFRNATGVQTSFAASQGTTGDAVIQGRDSDAVLSQYVDATDPNDASSGIAVLRYRTPSRARLTDRNGNEVSQYVVPRDGVYVTVTDLDRQSVTTGTVLPSQVDYDSQVQVVFNDRCWKCHSPSGRTGGSLPPAGTTAPNQGGLDVTGFQSFKLGGNNPPVFVSGNGSGSLVVRKLNGAAAHQGGARPSALTTAELELVKNWIDQGATPPASPASLDYTRDLEVPLFRGRCDATGCHDTPTQAGGLDMTSPSQTAFVSNNRITPGDGPGSRVVRMLKGTLTHTGGRAGLTDQQVRTVSVWISQRIQDSQPAERLEFTGDVLPLLGRSCNNSRCHDAVNPAGNLDLTNHANLVRGGTNGNPTLPGDGAESLLIKTIDGRVNHTGGFGDPPVVPAETAMLTAWINQGATAPPTPPAASAPVTTNSVLVTVSDSATGDAEELTLRELAASLGTFRNPQGFPAIVQPASTTNRTIDTAGGSTLTAIYTDTQDPADSSQDTAGVALNGTGSVTTFTDSAGSKKTQYGIGAQLNADRVFITVDDPNRNANPLAFDFVNATLLDSQTGDSETLQLRETGENSGQFRNVLGFPSVVGLAVTDNKLQSAGGATITANYTDPSDRNDFSFDLASMFVSPGTTPPQLLITDAAGTELTDVPFTKDPLVPTLFVTVLAQEENTNASVQETLTVTVSSPRDTVTFSLQETSTNTGTFRNPAGVQLLLGNGNANNRALEAFDGDPLTVRFFSRRRNQVFSSTAGRYVARLTPGNATVSFTAVDGTAMTTYTIGDRVYVTVSDPDQNANPNIAEPLDVTVTSDVTGDSERVVLLETNCNSGVFRNTPTQCGSSLGTTAELTSTVAVPVANDGFLETADRAIVRVLYVDPNDPADAQPGAATMLIPEVPSRISFIRGPRAIGTVSSYYIGSGSGQRLFVRVTDPDSNTSPISTQVINVTIRDPNTRDVESVSLAEVTSSSPIFENPVGLATRVTTASANDGVLGTQDGSSVVATYQDSTFPTDRATAAATLAVTETAATLIHFTDSAGQRKLTPYIIGREGVFVTVADQDENRSPSVSESVIVTVRDLVTGDSETVTLVETRTDSGEFRNISPGVSLTVDSAHPGDGLLQTAHSSTLIATYTDQNFPSDTLSTIPGATTSRPSAIGFVVFTDRDDNPVSSYIIGLQPIYLRLVDADQNTNPLTRETVSGQVRLLSRLTGDALSVAVTESASNSGLFRNPVGVPTRVAQRVNGDSELQVSPGDIVTAEYTDVKPAAVTTQTVRMDVQRTQSAVTLVSAPRGTRRTQYQIGVDRVHVQVEDPDQNMDPFTTETVQVSLRNGATGDTEVVNLLERTTNDRFFDSVAGVASVVDTANNADGTLQSSDRSQLTATYIDRVDLTDRSTANATMVVPKTTATIDLTDATGAHVSPFRIGVDALHITVSDADRNTDASTAQSVLVTLTDTSGDRMSVQLAETSFNSGVFRNLNLAPGPGQPVVGQVLSAVALPVVTNSRLETADADVATASYLDERGTTSAVISATSVMSLASTTSTIAFTDEFGNRASFYTIGISGIYVTVADIDQNRDPRVREQLVAEVRSSPVGDRESVNLLETTSSSAVFRNLTPLSSVVGPRITTNGTLEASDGGTASATYRDPRTPTDVSQATVGTFLDQANSRVRLTRSAEGSIVATEPGYAVDANQAISELIFAEVRDPDQNTSGSSAQTLVVTLAVILPGGALGDTELLELTEVSNNSDTFRNVTGMPSVIGDFRANDRVLETTSGATLTVTYVDPDFVFDRSEYRARTRIRQTAAVLESTDVDGVPVTRFLVSVEPVFAQVTDTDQNRNPSARESIPVTFSSQLGDLEAVQALETAADTGVFRMQSGMRTLIATNPVRGNGVLEVIGVGVQEVFTIRYVDREDASDAPTVNPLVVFQEPSAVSFLDRDGNVTTEYVRGIDGVVVRVRDRDSNRSAGVAETVTATVEDLITHDVEVLNLLETGVNTGLFSNSGRPLQSVLVFPPSPVLGDGVLQAGAVAHLVRAVYRDAKDPSDTSNGTANLRPQDALDSDGDGMPDAWESANGLNLSDPRDASLDNDGDGRTNLQEFRDGTDPNNPNDNRPIARPGQPRTVHPGRVTLDGTGSSSPGGLPLTYRWRQVTGSAVALSGSDTATPSFTALPAGLYEFELTVNNGRVDSFANRVAITVQDVAPVAEAGPVFTIDVGQSFSFHGEASRDPNSSRLVYSWLPLAGSLPAPANATGPTPIYAPVQARYYPIQLTVTDPAGNSSVSRTGLLVNGGASDHLPSADPGPDRVARAGSPVTLDGSASGDSDGNTLAYRWNFVSGPEVVTLTRSGALAIFTPLRDGFYQFELSVNDSTTSDPARDSAPVAVGVLINGTNNVPTANPGADQIVSTGTRVVLDGRSSADPDHTILSYRWRQVGGASVELSSTTSAAPSFIPVLSGIHRFELIVNDGQVDSRPVTVRVRVDSPGNRVPIANAGPDATGNVGTVVSLSGASSFDEDATPLAYLWTQKQGPSVTLSNQSGPAPAFRPLAAGLYAFELTVSDGVNLSAPDRVELSVSSATNRPPVANAGNDQTVFLGANALTVQLNGTGSYDPDGSFGVTYLWTQTSGTTVSLAPEAGSPTPTFTAPGIGNLEFSLTVRDRTGLRSSADKVVVTVVDGTTRPPLAVINGGSPGGNETVFKPLDQVVTLDAGSSLALSGGQLSYFWTQTAGPTVVLSNRTASQVSFIPRLASTYTFQLTVTDTQGRSSTSSVTVFAGSQGSGGTGGTDLGSVPQAGGGSGCRAGTGPGAAGWLDALLLLLPVLALRRRKL